MTVAEERFIRYMIHHIPSGRGVSYTLIKDGLKMPTKDKTDDRFEVMRDDDGNLIARFTGNESPEFIEAVINALKENKEDNTIIDYGETGKTANHKKKTKNDNRRKGIINTIRKLVYNKEFENGFYTRDMVKALTVKGIDAPFQTVSNTLHRVSADGILKKEKDDDGKNFWMPIKKEATSKPYALKSYGWDKE